MDRFQALRTQLLKDLDSLSSDQRAPVAQKASVPDVKVLKNDDGSDSRVLRFVISTKDIDRDGDTIDPKGWDLENFHKGGKMLWAHDSRQMPVGVPLKTWVTGGKLKSHVEFMTEDINPNSDLTYKAYKAGLLSATSVGFRPIKWIVNEDRKGQWGMPGLDFIEQELLEFSAVPVPSNPNALLEVDAKSFTKGNFKLWHDWVEAELDGEGSATLFLDRKVLEETHAVLKNKAGIAESTVIDLKPTIDPVEPTQGDLVKAIQDGIEAVTKSGRTLSKRNEDLLAGAAADLKTVLDSVAKQDPATDEDPDKDGKPVTIKTDLETSADLDNEDNENSDEDDNEDGFYDLSDIVEASAVDSTAETDPGSGEDVFELEGIDTADDLAASIRDIVAREIITPLTGKVL